MPHSVLANVVYRAVLATVSRKTAVQEGCNESKQPQDAGMQLRLQEKTTSPPDSALEEADWQAAQAIVVQLMACSKPHSAFDSDACVTDWNSIQFSISSWQQRVLLGQHCLESGQLSMFERVACALSQACSDSLVISICAVAQAPCTSYSCRHEWSAAPV